MPLVPKGRNFPERSNYQLVIEAKFDRETLITDPVAHSRTPQFEQELAWELDRATLRQHRLQRSPIKLQVIAVATPSGTREPLGYMVLDIRSISDRKTFKWCPILNSKYRTASEIYCGIYIDQDERSNDEIKGLDEMPLSPRPYVEASGGRNIEIIQLGPRNLIQDDFVLSISVVSILNLTPLIPVGKDSGLPEFQLTLMLFGLEENSAAFSEDNCTRLSEQKWTFLLRSSVELIKAYFSRPNILGISLQMNGNTIGSIKTNLVDLIPDAEKSLCHAVCLDGTFTIMDQCGREVRVILRFEIKRNEDVAVGDLREFNRIQRSNNALNSSPETKNCNRVNDDSTLGDDEKLSVPLAPDIDAALSHLLNNVRQTCDTLPDEQPIPSTTTAPPLPSQFTNTNVQFRRFCYTIELRTLRACVPLPCEVFVYARYVYPIFGTTNPVMTLPPVKLPSDGDGQLSQGYCTFEMAADPAEFRARLAEEPLTVEILSRSGSNEVVFGLTSLDLAAIFDLPVTELKSCKRRHIDGVAEVKSKPGGPVVAKLTYTLLLDDFGIYQPGGQTQPGEATSASGVTSCLWGPSYSHIEGLSTERTAEPHTNSSTALTSSSSSVPVPSRPVAPPPVEATVEMGPRAPPLTGVRQTPEYRAALELELWKAREEDRFKAGLREREKRIMLVFAEEWQKRENERELLCKRKIQEYSVLEEKLRTTLENLIKREQQLALNETAMRQAQRDYERALEQREKELVAAVYKRIQDAEASLVATRERCNQLNNELNGYRDKYADLECQLMEEKSKPPAPPPRSPRPSQQVEEALSKEKEEVRKLQLELVRITTELTASQNQLSVTERRLDGALRGRMRYKELWARALHEVARLKQEAETATRNALTRREAELEGLRKEQRFLLHAGDTGSVNPSGNTAPTTAAASLTQIRTELQRLQAEQASAPADDECKVTDAQLARLTEERRNLLSSGVYYEDDQIVVDLDREIQRLLTTGATA